MSLGPVVGVRPICEDEGMPLIHRAGPPDIDALLGLIEAFYLVDDHDYDPGRVAAALEPLLADDRRGQVWMASDGSESLGYAVVTWGWSLESGGLECLLDEIYATRQGEGIGAALLERSRQEAARVGARVMSLETEARNDGARRFYRRHGFVEEDSTWMLAPLADHRR